jgi:hypothetical protein
VKRLFVALILILLLLSTLVVFLVSSRFEDGHQDPAFYVGVSFCGNTTDEGKLLIDRVKSYTNLFVLQSWPIRGNETAVKEICDYAVSQGLNIIVNLGTYYNDTWPWQFQVFKNADARWGKKFLGAYYNDEPGGLQLDYNWTGFFEKYSAFFSRNTSNSLLHDMYAKTQAFKINGTKPVNYDLETKVFLDYFTRDKGYTDLKSAGIKTFVSDYTLHWFDYLAGYDVVLAQFGSNSSYYKEIDLVKGAAHLQNKEWGAIITWKYSGPPYLDSGKEIYEQMMTACEAGAKYIVVFNYPQMDGNPYGVLQDEHFNALERFSNDAMAKAKMRTSSDVSKVDAVLVLPRNYGWGMRRSDDIIWGFWPADNKSAQVWDTCGKLILRYNIRLDIVYDDPSFPVAGKYQHIYYWNQTGL